MCFILRAKLPALLMMYLLQTADVQNGSIHRCVFVTLKTENFNQQDQHEVKHMLCVSGFGIPFLWPGPVVLLVLGSLSQDSSLSTTLFFSSHFTSGITKDWDKVNWLSWGSCWWGGCASMHAWPSSWSSQCSADGFHAAGCAAVPLVPGSHASHHLDRHIRYLLFMSPDSQTDIWTDTLGTSHSCHQIHKQISGQTH